MKFKKFLGITCAFLMIFAASTSLANIGIVSAAEESVRYYYGTTLASAGAGSTVVTSSLANGLQLNFGKASKASDASYQHLLDMNDFAAEFTFVNANFGETWFRFTDNDNDTKWVELTLLKENDKVAYKIKDNYKNETQQKTLSVDFTALTDEEDYASLSYADGKFALNGAALDMTGITTTSFYKNIAKMSVGVKNVDGSDDASDAVMRISSVKSSNGVQTLVTDNSRFEGEKRVAPVIIPKADGDDEAVTSPVTKTMNAASNAEFAFPYYCVDALGEGWYATVTEGAGEEGEKVLAKTRHTLGDAGKTYSFRIYPLSSSSEALVKIDVTAQDDTQKVAAANDKFDSFIKDSDELKEAFAQGHLVAPSEGNTFEFPHIRRENFGADGIFSAADDLDSFDNVKIQVGYKAPGDSGEYTYVSAYAVRINAMGKWSFRYKVTDSAGNATETAPFELRVFDEDAPTITVSDSEEIFVGRGYTVPTASISDNAAGVDEAFSIWTLYQIDENGERKEIKNLKEGEDGYEDNLLKNGVLTPTEVTPSGKDASFVIVYEARDLAGNVADKVETEIKVVETTPDYVTNPWNDFFRIALIVLACLAGVGIIVLIFLRPRGDDRK